MSTGLLNRLNLCQTQPTVTPLPRMSGAEVWLFRRMRTAVAVFFLRFHQFFERGRVQRLIKLPKVQPQVHEMDNPQEFLARVFQQVFVTYEQARHRRPGKP